VTATETVTFENTGSAPVSLDDVTIDEAAFTLQDDGGLPETLDPGENLTMAVTFDPTRDGNRTGTLSVFGADNTSVSLEGTGLAASIHVEPATLRFPPLGAGDRSPGIVEISNYGRTDLDVQDVLLTGNDSGQYTLSGVPSTVPPGGTETFTVCFDIGVLEIGDDGDEVESDSSSDDGGTSWWVWIIPLLLVVFLLFLLLAKRRRDEEEEDETGEDQETGERQTGD
jgi:MYXO-CTERM domain-containing protein